MFTYMKTLGNFTIEEMCAAAEDIVNFQLYLFTEYEDAPIEAFVELEKLKLNYREKYGIEWNTIWKF